MQSTPLRYLSASDVERAMPTIEERLVLARRTMTALVDDAQLPPKIAVHPAAPESFAHAMPAWMRGHDQDDLLGMKWVVGFPANVELGLPAFHGTVLLSDAVTGLPRAFIDAGPITAHRTAAVSGTALQRWGPVTDGRPRVAILGAGVQARSHLPVIAHLLPDADLVLCDRDDTRRDALADDVRSGRDSLGAYASVSSTADLAAAVDGADLVLSMVSFGPDRQVLRADDYAPAATIVAVDYDMIVPAALAAEAALFLTDDRGQFLANRNDTTFAGYPEPHAMIGQAILDDTPRPEGRVLVSHLGVGLADVVFGDAILRSAEAADIGTVLER